MTESDAAMDIPVTIAPPLLHGRLAFVTGAGRGNGRAIALGLARAGARVVATDVDEGSAGETARLVRDGGGTAWSFGLDVTSAQQCAAVVAAVATQAGLVDLLVNNAGIIVREGIDSPNAPANWRRTMDVNVNGAFNVTHACLAALKARRGTIVNIASIAAFAGQANSLGYSPSKGAIKLLTQSLAAELAPAGVRVNALAPGVIETAMTVPTLGDPQRLAKFMNRIPMARVGQPVDLVGPVVFLSSDMSGYVTGVTLAVDGGFLAA
jgi:NAD(P)-dependent dehydrogenase (short-subunit alcohol dehydrogenase family)